MSRSEAVARYGRGEYDVEIAPDYGVSPHTIRRWASEAGVKRGSLLELPAHDGGTVAGSPLAAPAFRLRRCRNRDCDEEFVPLNPQHWYHEPACRAAKDSKKTVREVLTEEAGLDEDAGGLEIAKAAFGQKNRLLREVSRLKSLRDYLSYEVQTLFDERPELRYPVRWEPVVMRPELRAQDRELVLVCSDWQVGKLENGIGVQCMEEERIPRILDAFASILQHFRSAGYPVNKAHVAFVGDMIEGCYIYRGQNVTGLDRTGNTHRLTRQIGLAAHLQASVVAHVASMVPTVDVHVVGGNHGRPNGPNDYADPEDNFDVMSARWAQDKCGNFNNINWDIHDHWWAGYEVAQHYVVMMHGDQWSGPLYKLESLLPQWVTADVFGAIYRPDIVVVGHRHDHAILRVNGMTVVQNGTIDGGSNWYLKAYGKASRPSQTVLVMSPKHGLEATYAIHF